MGQQCRNHLGWCEEYRTTGPHPTSTKPLSTFIQDAHELFQHSHSRRALLSFFWLLRKSAISAEAKKRFMNQGTLKNERAGGPSAGAKSTVARKGKSKPPGQSMWQCQAKKQTLQSIEVMCDCNPSTQEAEAGGSHGQCMVPVILALKRWRKTDQRFKAILSYISNFKAGLSYMRPCL